MVPRRIQPTPEVKPVKGQTLITNFWKKVRLPEQMNPHLKPQRQDDFVFKVPYPPSEIRKATKKSKAVSTKPSVLGSGQPKPQHPLSVKRKLASLSQPAPAKVSKPRQNPTKGPKAKMVQLGSQEVQFPLVRSATGPSKSKQPGSIKAKKPQPKILTPELLAARRPPSTVAKLGKRIFCPRLSRSDTQAPLQ